MDEYLDMTDEDFAYIEARARARGFDLAMQAGLVEELECAPPEGDWGYEVAWIDAQELTPDERRHFDAWLERTRT